MAQAERDAVSHAPPPLYRRTLVGFEPDTEAAKIFWRETKPGALVRLEGTRPRNAGRHRFYWKMLTIAAENMPRFETPERLHYAVKQALRLGEFVPIRGGKEMVFIPASTSFARMKEAEFVKFLEDADALLSESLGVEIGTLMREAEAA
jgi:hypothetical protein